MRKTPDARFATSNITYGRQPSQPCRRYDVFAMQHLATPDVVDELFVTCLPTSHLLTSAERNKVVR